MTEWETDDVSLTKAIEATPLTIRTEPYCPTPSTKSKRLAEYPESRLSPSTMATDRNDKGFSRDFTNDESISILDPRRFTPTLHANLVSEILALRRDQDEKIRQIESLESALYLVKEEHEQLQENLASTSKESRSLKRQLSLLEGGTSSALGEVARERDEAVDLIADVRKRLEAAQKKIRSQEDDSQKVHDLWAQEKDDWEDARRKYERRLHIAESRLKTVLDEVTAYQASQTDGLPNGHIEGYGSDGGGSEKEQDTASVRTMSLSNSIRHSLLHGPILQPGNSLADELSFDDDDHTDADDRESVLSCCTSLNHSYSFVHDDGTAGGFHHGNPSMESFKRPGSVAGESRLFINPAALKVAKGEDEEAIEISLAVKASYTNTGVQYSPPPSPMLPQFKPPTPDFSPRRVRTPESSDSPARADGEVEANQRKKRVQLHRPLSIEPPKDGRMISTSAQTVEMPLSPPKTPLFPLDDQPATHSAPMPMIAASTQTDVPQALSRGMSSVVSRFAQTPPPLQIPTINIQPPTSHPSTPREPLLPQYFKNFGCQVNLSSATSTADASAQTEGIQVDRRIGLLPTHLQPSAISSRPTSPKVAEIGCDHGQASSAPGSIPPRNPRRLTNNLDTPDLPVRPITSGQDNDEILSMAEADENTLPHKRASRRSNGFSSSFAAFDTASSEEGDEFADLDVSDSEYRTALSAPKPRLVSMRVTKRGLFGTAIISHQQDRSKVTTGDSNKGIGTDPFKVSSFADKENFPKGHGKRLSRKLEKALARAPPSNVANHGNRIGVIRKTAMIQRGMVSQRSRSRSPSLLDGNHPPFPIPTRASSKRSLVSLKTAPDGWESPTRGGIWHKRASSRSSYQSHNIRKVRSAAALSRASRYRRYGSRSPPPLSPSTESPESPGLPPLPRNDITTPRAGHDRAPSSYRKHRHGLSTNTNNTQVTNITALTTDTSASHTTGVVDAMAQTMVGEWMLKYVRRRKSFNVPENMVRDDSSNDRHKRWVWLAPYERSVLWSSRQPSSGSALLGKSGRKLTIQSVLDVKDDNPAPKVGPPVFNRSILILTPQRALKFTASSAKRHYVWLTALSFLAHSSQALPETISMPQPLVHVDQRRILEFGLPQTKIKRGGIRDSIRLAKRKSPMPKARTPSMPTSAASVPPSRMSEATGGGPASSSALSGGHSREQSREAAEPPFIPRFLERSANVVASHGRRRSNTGGHVAPPLSFRGFSGPAGNGSLHNSGGRSTGNGSVDTTASSELYQTQGSTNVTWNMSQTTSQRTSEASSGPGNFFDAVGTVRMEAFISPLAYSQNNESPDDRSEDYRRNVRKRSKGSRTSLMTQS